MRFTNWLWVYIFLIASNVQAAPDCAEGQTYTTSKGAVFKCVKQGVFGDGWQAPNRTIWGIVQIGSFRNSGLVTNGIVIDSEATRACHAIEGLLPTIDDYKKLQSYFEHVETLTEYEFTGIGLRDLLTLFPDMWRGTFWSSSAFQTYGWLFHGNTGVGLNGEIRYSKNLTRCVRKP